MKVSAIEEQEGFSDYGSDFTPDEEEILKALLQQPFEPDNPITQADLKLNDVEDAVNPKGARIRRRDWSRQNKASCIYQRASKRDYVTDGI